MIGSENIKLPAQTQGLGDANGGKAVGDLILPDAAISWDGTEGHVSGNIRYVSGYSAYPPDEQDGHFFPIRFDSEHFGKEITVAGGGREKTIVPTAADPFLVIRAENFSGNGWKVAASEKATGKELFSLDFSGAVMDCPVGAEAVSVPPQSKDFGKFGKTSSYIGEDVSIAWDGPDGAVSGTLRHSGNSEVFQGDDQTGWYYPVILGEWFSGKRVSVNGKELTDTEIIMCLNKIKQKPERDFEVRLLDEVPSMPDNLVARLSFKGATFEEE